MTTQGHFETGIDLRAERGLRAIKNEVSPCGEDQTRQLDGSSAFAEGRRFHSEIDLAPIGATSRPVSIKVII